MTAGHDATSGATSGAQSPKGPERPKGAVPARMALCRHRGAPEGEHLDLFLGPFDPSAPPHEDALIARSWRLPLAVWTEVWPNIPTAAGALAAGDGHTQLTLGHFSVIATPPHRATYLSLSESKTLDAGRGIVEPLAQADGWMIAETERCLAAFRWPNARGHAPYALRIALQRTPPHADDAWSLALSIVRTTSETSTEIE